MKYNKARFLLTATLLPLSPLWLKAADNADPAPAVQAAHDEAATRQKLIVSANQAISDGNRLLGSGNYDEAAGRFQYALDSLTPGGVSATSFNRAEVGLAAAKAGQAQGLAKDYKFAQAAALIQESIRLQPDNPVYTADLEELQKEQLAYEEQVRDPEGTTSNPAVTDEFKGRVAAAQKLLFQGDAYFRTGQFDKAETTYSKILLLDPYNKAARDKMAHIELYKTRAAGFRHEEYEQAAMEQLNHKWAEDISPDIVSGPEEYNEGASKSSNRALINHKLSSIIIDKVNFEKLDIAAVIQFLQQKSKELDPDHQGINFVLRLTSNTTPPADATPAAGGAAAPAPAAGEAPPTDTAHSIHREVSITLTDVPLSEVLSYVLQQTNLQSSVEDYAVYLRPSIDEGETLTVRTFLVPPNFFPGGGLHVTVGNATDASTTTIESVKQDVVQQLTDKGIRFPAGATASFLPGSSKLVVRDTPEQLDLIANLIEQLSKEVPQIQIEAKIAEFNQEAIKALSFNYLAGISGSPVPTSVRFGVATALRTSDSPLNSDSPPTSALGGLNPDGISTLIANNSGNLSGGVTLNPLSQPNAPSQSTNPYILNVANNTPNTLTIGAVIDGTGLAAVIEAINNLQGVSLLSAPSVTTQNGLKANIDIVREFPYPTSFEKPKLSNNTNLAYGRGSENTDGTSNAGVPLILAIPPTPREFVTQDVGVSLEVKPTTYPDQRIDLDITKAQVLDFDGFIDYGVPILARQEEQNPKSTDPGTIVTTGTINQPVFNLRSMVTDLQVLDGQTAVLGGLIREDTQEINDKVPVLGDLPFVGRMFQSKVSERTKKSLLIFVTARLIRTNGKPEYVRTLEAEPEEEALPEPEPIGPGATLPLLPEGTPNS
jgi:general secretion pathway protein D